MLPIKEIIEDLAIKQPVFHSEADFQHTFAWEIHKRYPEAKVRLEVHPGRIGKREYIDIWVKLRNKIYAIELKYKTKKIEVRHDDEEFFLLNQSAQDVGRYDFIKDICRLERFVKNHSGAIGYAIMLTNDDNYWKVTTRTDTVDADFRIHEGKVLKGRLNWNGASEGTMKGRNEALQLQEEYLLHWVNYSKLPEVGPNQFRYLLLTIKE